MACNYTVFGEEYSHEHLKNLRATNYFSTMVARKFENQIKEKLKSKLITVDGKTGKMFLSNTQFGLARKLKNDVNRMYDSALGVKPIREVEGYTILRKKQRKQIRIDTDGITQAFLNRLDAHIRAEDERLMGINKDGESQIDDDLKFAPGEILPENNQYLNFLKFKENMLYIAKNRLAKVKSERRRYKDNKAKTKELIRLEKKLEDRIFGNDAKGITGLEKEIADMKANPINNLQIFVEADLQRMEALKDSENPDDMKEARKIINFYEKAGVFRVDVDNPFYPNGTTDEDGIIHVDSFTQEFFKQWAKRATEAGNEITAREQELITKQMNSLKNVQDVFKAPLSFKQIMHKEEGLKDLTWIDMMVMDVTAGVFSHNGILPQAMMSHLQDAFEDRLSGKHFMNGTMSVREVAAEIDNIQPEVAKILKAKGYDISAFMIPKTGKALIDAVSYELYQQTYNDGVVTENGVTYTIKALNNMIKDPTTSPADVEKYKKLKTRAEANSNKTGRLVHRYTPEFFDARKQMEHEYNKKVAIARTQANPITERAHLRAAAQFRKKWYRDNVVVLNITQLPEVQALVNSGEFSEFASYMKQPGNHEAELKALLGEKGYAEEVEKQIQQIRNYQVQREVFIEEILTEKGVTSIPALPFIDQAQIRMWEKENNPFDAVSDYYTNDDLAVGNLVVHSNMKYTISVPRKVKSKSTLDPKTNEYRFADTNQDTYFYDEKYAEIEADDTLKRFYDLSASVTKAIRTVLPHDMQQRLGVNSVPAQRKAMIEILLDKNTNVFVRFIKAVKEMWDRIKELFGITVQSDVSHAAVDVTSGLPDYEVSTQFLSDNRKKIDDMYKVQKIKFLQALNEGRIDAIGDLRIYTKIKPGRLTPQAIEFLAEYLGIPPDINEIRKLAGPDGTIQPAKIIRRGVQHRVVQEQSFDLPKLMKMYSWMAMEYAARTEAMSTLEVMKSHYDDIKRPATQNTGVNLKNAKQNNKTRLEDTRARAVRQMNNWFERAVLGNYGTKHTGLIKRAVRAIEVVDQEGRIGKAKEQFKNAAAPIVPTFVKKWAKKRGGPGKILTTQDKHFWDTIEEAIAKETDPDKIAELEYIRDGLGKDFAATKFFMAILDFVRFKMLGYNISSSVTNLVEGYTSNMIIASTGTYMKPESMYKAMSIVRSSVFKNLAPEIAHRFVPGAVKARTLMDKFRILQDSSNELQKASAKSAISGMSKFAPYELVRRVEYVNQSPIMISMLMEEEITGGGQTSNVWDALNPDGTLKPPFNTQENIETWVDATSEKYKNWKRKVNQVIKNAHGDYDQLSGMLAKAGVAGKALMMFKTWLPRQVYQRFAINQTDIMGINTDLPMSEYTEAMIKDAMKNTLDNHPEDLIQIGYELGMMAEPIKNYLLDGVKWLDTTGLIAAEQAKKDAVINFVDNNKEDIIDRLFNNIKNKVPATKATKKYYDGYSKVEQNRILNFKGRYWSHTRASAAIHGATAGFFLFGALGAGVGAVGGAIYGHTRGQNTGISMMQEMLYTLKASLLKMAGMPVNALLGKDLIPDHTSYDQFISAEFSERDAKNMSANITDISLIMTWIGLTLLTKALLWEDDDEDKERRAMHNVLANRFLQLASQGLMYVNPVELWDNTIGNLPVLRWVNDCITLGKKSMKAWKGYDIIPTGVNAGESAVWNQTERTLLPSMAKDIIIPVSQGDLPKFGFESAMHKQFKAAPFDDWFWSDYKKAKKRIKGQRAKMKKELLRDGVPENRILKILNKNLPYPPKPKPKVKKKD